MLSLVEIGRIVDAFTPNAPTQLNCLVKSDFLVRTRLNSEHFNGQYDAVLISKYRYRRKYFSCSASVSVYPILLKPISVSNMGDSFEKYCSCCQFKHNDDGNGDCKINRMS